MALILHRPNGYQTGCVGIRECKGDSSQFRVFSLLPARYKPGEFRLRAKKAQVGRMQNLVGWDANAHHVISGSTTTNKRGESLLAYFIANRLDIVYRVNERTFIDIRRTEVMDLNIGTFLACSAVTNYHMLENHRYIRFDLKSDK